jgi:lysyl-tRNA synthetase class 2
MTIPWRPAASVEVLRLRARLLAEVREFFRARGVLEVETPVLGRATATDVHLASLATTITGRPGSFYLQTSPETAMKRLLAAGSGDVYQICKVFRDGEAGPQHSPEFTLIEWYRVGFDHLALMGEVEALLARLLGGCLAAPAERLTYREAFERVLGLDPFAAPLALLGDVAARRLGADPAALGPDRDTVLDLLMGALVGPALGRGRITFVHAYPASQAALARLSPEDPSVAARFEAYVGGVELCNGFHELTDAAEQRRRFDRDRAARAARGLPALPVDERLLAALAAGLPDSAGVAVGFDRIVMLAAGLATIGDAVSFGVDES